MDGALSNNLPLFELGNTITVAPFSGESDICPQEGTLEALQVHYGNVSIRVTTRNVHRICTSFLPPRLEVCPWSECTPELCAAGCPLGVFRLEQLCTAGRLCCYTLTWFHSWRCDVATDETCYSLSTFMFLSAPPRQMLADICHDGYRDALRFLLQRGELLLLCLSPHLRSSASLGSSVSCV